MYGCYGLVNEGPDDYISPVLIDSSLDVSPFSIYIYTYTFLSVLPSLYSLSQSLYRAYSSGLLPHTTTF
ncbi:uncharacterized protein BDV14DRAFT_179459 [Aspergillus stella-maris]|uniref:uncharacterized protein n=1 Tax=Aspergillus stella-maris TaxID=1810926 RepID=UPI003CCE06F7